MGLRLTGDSLHYYKFRTDLPGVYNTPHLIIPCSCSHFASSLFFMIVKKNRALSEESPAKEERRFIRVPCETLNSVFKP